MLNSSRIEEGDRKTWYYKQFVLRFKERRFHLLSYLKHIDIFVLKTTPTKTMGCKSDPLI